MRLVLDTNVLVSAFLWQGKPGRLIELAGEGEIEIFTSRALIAELSEVLHRKKFSRSVQTTGLNATQMVRSYRRLAGLVKPRKPGRRVSPDRDDDHVLACALGARADLIVSGDDDLLGLARFRGIRILSPADALQAIAASLRS
jgi:putative PIN family toxin of toxin-antitoxin system